MDSFSRNSAETSFPSSGSSNETFSFVTFFDSGYLSRGLALVESIREQGVTNQLLVVCLDEMSFELLSTKADELRISPVKLDELIGFFPELAQARKNRSVTEFYFTLTPFVVKFALLEKPQNHTVIYLDADLYFFRSPLEVVRALENASVALIRHNYPWFLKSIEKKYGTYNVGLLAFRNNEDGLRVLEWWGRQCFDWCHDFPERGKYADQGYLNDFFNFSKNIKVLSNPGFNLAPWNSASSKLKLNLGNVSVNENDLVFFHFHGLKRFGKLWISSQLNYYSPMSRGVFLTIYGSYVKHLVTVESRYDLNLDSSIFVSRKGVGIRGFFSSIAKIAFSALSVVLGQVVSDKAIEEVA
jgi:hypothetical protein